MNRRHFSRMALLLCTSSMAWAGAGMAAAADEAPDAMVQRLSNEVLETLRTDKTIRSGNINRIIAETFRTAGYPVPAATTITVPAAQR